jgi:NADH:ubiquinone oxidoreductase subunit D
MTDVWKNDKDFKEAIGSFIIAFSELEFGLVFLCSMTEFDVRKKDEYITKYLGFTFEKKMQHLTDFISEYLEELKPIWEKIKIEIGQLNRERRFLVHGFMTYYLPHESITTHVKENGKLTTKKQTLEEIKSFTNRLHHLNTGENGINGEFHTLFTQTRINKWNDLVNNENKIIYRVNSKIISDWTGNEKTTA